MRIASTPHTVTLGDTELPLWPPLLATRGRGSRSVTHMHHAMHIVLALEGELAVRAGKSTRAPWERAAGVLTAPDVPHAIDAEGIECFLVFLDPESDVGAALGAVLTGPVRLIAAGERARLLREPMDPFAVMAKDGVAWTEHAVAVLGGAVRAEARRIHPRVRRLLKLLRTMPADADTSLEALAEAVDLSPGRLMHAFSESMGVPLRPYLAWLRIQRAAAAVASGLPLAHAAHTAGFADSAHMSRTFRRMFGMTPSALQP